MSDDLISRKWMIKQFCVSENGQRIPEYDIDNFPVTISIKDVKDVIRKAPKAFDREKVIEELRNPDNYTMVAGKHFTTVDRSVDIVKKGGIG